MAYTDDLHSLSHTKWNCKYHVVFAPKYRRRAFYEASRLEDPFTGKKKQYARAGHICAVKRRSESRALPASEKPPAQPVDIYLVTEKKNPRKEFRENVSVAVSR